MTQPQLRVRGAATRAPVPNVVEAEVSDNDDLPPPLEPMEFLQPALPIRGRAPVMSPRRFTIYRSQGVTTGPAVVDTRTDVLSGRRSRLSRRSPSESDEDDTWTPSDPMPSFALPWRREATGSLTSLEQYLVIVVDDQRMFFRINIYIERTSRGFHPTVSVVFVTGDNVRGAARDIWVIFAGELESSLLRELDRAFRRAASGGRSEA